MESGNLHTGDMRPVADEEPLGIHRFEGVDETLVVVHKRTRFLHVEKMLVRIGRHVL